MTIMTLKTLMTLAIQFEDQHGILSASPPSLFWSTDRPDWSIPCPGRRVGPAIHPATKQHKNEKKGKRGKVLACTGTGDINFGYIQIKNDSFLIALFLYANKASPKR